MIYCLYNFTLLMEANKEYIYIRYYKNKCNCLLKIQTFSRNTGIIQSIIWERVRERPFNLKGGLWFFSKKNILIPNVAEIKNFRFWWRKKKINILTRVVRKKILSETKNIIFFSGGWGMLTILKYDTSICFKKVTYMEIQSLLLY